MQVQMKLEGLAIREDTGGLLHGISKDFFAPGSSLQAEQSHSPIIYPAVAIALCETVNPSGGSSRGGTFLVCLTRDNADVIIWAVMVTRKARQT
jgi:hypothetical protein